MAKFDPSQNQNLLSRLPKIVIGDQVCEETRCAKFGADQCMGSWGEICPFSTTILFRPTGICFSSFKQPTGQTA